MERFEPLALNSRETQGDRNLVDELTNHPVHLGLLPPREDVRDQAHQPAGMVGEGDRIELEESPQFQEQQLADRKSTRLNSSHSQISYAVFCLKKKKSSRLLRHADAEDQALPPDRLQRPSRRRRLSVYRDTWHHLTCRPSRQITLHSVACSAL